MRIFLLVIIGIYLTVDFLSTFIDWMHSKNRREYWLRCFDTVITGAIFLGFAKLITMLEVAL